MKLARLLARGWAGAGPFGTDSREEAPAAAEKTLAVAMWP